MATYSKLSDLLNTTFGMTTLRNNSAQDDGVDTITGVSWFKFNGITVSNMYVSGNSFVGFGSNTEHLKICRRDCKMYYLYRQEGVIGATKFLKIRWEGYAQYSQTSASYALKWELFLFDDGGIFLNLVTVPSVSGYLGTNSLVCGSKTYNFTVILATPSKYSFIPADNGTFELTGDEYPVFVNRVPFGSCEFYTDAIRDATSVKTSYISWTDEVPTSTSLKVFVRLSTGQYLECTKGEPLPCVNSGDNLSDETLYIRVEMSTEDPILTPILKEIRIQIYNVSDMNVIVLVFGSGTLNSIQRAVGDITIAYDGSGSLMGQGGPVLAFEHTFTPLGLDPKNNPHAIEHLGVSNIRTIGNLIEIFYSKTYETERIELADITATGVLIHVDDL